MNAEEWSHHTCLLQEEGSISGEDIQRLNGSRANEQQIHAAQRACNKLWSQTSVALPLRSCVTLSESLNLSEP